MKKGFAAILVVLVAVFAGTAFAGNPASGPGDCDRAAGKIEASARSPHAIGVVKRDAETPGRYVIEAIEGTFMPGARVVVLTPAGDVVAHGTVHSVYDDETYVDAAGSPAVTIPVGFSVLMNYPDDEARATVLARSGPIKDATQEIRQENGQIRNEIARETRREEADREKWQEDMTRLNKEQDYQYSATYNSWRYSPYWYWR